MITLKAHKFYLEEKKHLQASLIALEKFINEIKPNFSTDVEGNITCGYGKLDNLGYFEYPLPYELIQLNKQ